jgi:DNA (cytosine-5)-methyltransferase 1
MRAPLTVGSLFSGIGGLELGLERAGMRVVWQAETDDYARRVLAKHWPSVHCYRDAREVGADAARVDLICGGFPCQDISNAGQRAGIDGTRSGLWGEYIRIVRELRPRYVLVENVSALLARGMGRVLGDLAASGYDAEWDCIPAAAVGAPHRRDRVFVVAYANGEPVRHAQQREEARRVNVQDSRRVVPRLDGLERHVADAEREGEPQPRGRLHQERRRPSNGSGKGRGKTVSDAERAGLEVRVLQPAREEFSAAQRGGLPSDAWTAEPDVGRVAHGVPARVDRLRCLGNAVVPQVAEYIGRRIVTHAQERAA